MSQKKIKAIRLIVKSYFKNAEGKPYEITDGECEIFANIIDRGVKWLWQSAPTRYGKSEISAMALIFLAAFYNVKIPVVAGSEDKAAKIMEYVVQHLADHPKFYEGLINIQLSQIDKLKLTVSKDALRWADGGWIFITSIESRSISKEGEGVIGEGGDIVFLEEAGLIRNKEQFSKIVRMSEEDRGWGKLIMSGNCVEKSVFEDAFNDPMFKKVRIDLEQAIAEGRFRREFIEDKKKYTTSKDWKRLYLVEFPEANEFTYFKPEVYEYLPRNDQMKYWGAMDPALGESKKGSLVGIVVLGRDEEKGQVYEVYNSGVVMKPEEATQAVFNLPYKFERFGIEAIQFQKYFLHQLEEKSKIMKKYIPFEGIEQKQAKEVRIESMEPMVNTGQIKFQGQGELWDEMQDYPLSDHLDVMDTLEMAWRMMASEDIQFGFV